MQKVFSSPFPVTPSGTTLELYIGSAKCILSYRFNPATSHPAQKRKKKIGYITFDRGSEKKNEMFKNKKLGKKSKPLS